MIRIITDSVSDITPERAEQLNVTVAPLSVRFGEESYVSGYELTNEAFYEKLATAKEMPASSQVNPYTFEEEFKKCLDAGDEVIAILLAKELSGTYQSAVIAKENIGSDKITIIDSRTAAVAQALLVEEAVKMRDRGCSYQEIVEQVNDLTKRAHLFIILDTLEYLKRGGRISGKVAFVGGVLGLHPVITVTEGKVDLIDKVKGKKNIHKWFINKMKEVPADRNYSFCLGHTNDIEKCDKLAEFLKANGYEESMSMYCMGPIVGTHLGPGSVSIGYIEK